MALGIRDHVWLVAELVQATAVEEPITDRPRFGRFQVIQGGRAYGLTDTLDIPVAGGHGFRASVDAGARRRATQDLGGC